MARTRKYAAGGTTKPQDDWTTAPQLGGAGQSSGAANPNSLGVTAPKAMNTTPQKTNVKSSKISGAPKAASAATSGEPSFSPAADPASLNAAVPSGIPQGTAGGPGPISDRLANPSSGTSLAGDPNPGGVWNSPSGTPDWAKDPYTAGKGNSPISSIPPSSNASSYTPGQPLPPGTGPQGVPDYANMAPGQPVNQDYWNKYVNDPTIKQPTPGTPPRSGTTGGGLPWYTIGTPDTQQTHNYQPGGAFIGMPPGPPDLSTPNWNGPPVKEVFMNGVGYNVPMNTDMNQIGVGKGFTAPDNLPPWGLPAYGPDNPMPAAQTGASAPTGNINNAQGPMVNGVRAAKGGRIGYAKGGVVGDTKPRHVGVIHKHGSY